MKYVPPSVRNTAFNCPHCSALAQQFWHIAFVAKLNSDQKPLIVTDAKVEEQHLKKIEDPAKQARVREYTEKLLAGGPFIVEDLGTGCRLPNVHISRCFNCKELAIWVYDRMVYPARGEAAPANPDLPGDIRRDYDEASSIIDLSPRGAAALIRLAIQKLCKHLGQPGENLNKDIGTLVSDGLEGNLQKAFDSVRVIGNNAVHPGRIDIRDDRATAEALFRLLNLIADRLISEPKHIDEIYSRLPAESRHQIDKRDG